MSRKDTKRPRSRSNSPQRKGDRNEDRKPRKSARGRSRSRSNDHDRREHHNSSSRRRYNDNRSRSRSQDRSRKSERSDRSHRSERSERSERSHKSNESKESKQLQSTSTSSIDKNPKVDEHVLEHLVEGGVAPEIAVQRAAEQAVLDEEIRKRREKVKAWQEAKRLKEEQEKLAAGEILTVNAAESSSESKGHTGDEHGVATSVEADADNSEISHKPHGWNLEDDDEEEEEGAVENSAAGSMLGEGLGTASPPHALLPATEEETADAFQRLAAMPAKAHTEHGLSHVTAVSLAASVSAGISGTTTTDEVPPGVAASSLGSKRRMSRLKASKWDSDTHGDAEGVVEAPVSVPNGAHSTSSTAPSTLSSPPSATPAAAVQAKEAEEEEDPLEAFMSSLYETGDVAEQRALPATRVPPQLPDTATAASHTLPKTITLEDILAGNIPERVADPAGQDTDRHAGHETPPSPQFAPALKNYPSSSSLMAKSPSLRALSAATATSFDNLNRGWESDAADTAGENFSIGIAGMDDADSVDDNGEVPWHMMSSKEKKKERKERGEQHTSNSNGEAMEVDIPAGGSATTATAGSGPSAYSESESEQENAETEVEREAREIREKQEFIDAIRRARAEEDQVRERLARMEERMSRDPGVSGPAPVASASSSTDNGQTSGGSSELGRIFSGDGDMVEEYEVETKRRSALEILEEAKKGKMLKEVDHSKVDYIPFRKNLYIMPRALSRLSEAEVQEKREDLQVKVRGKACPVPVDTWEQCGLADRILQTVSNLKLKEPFPIQKQAIPAIMCGRDVIGVAKTGSGKTIAFLLPMLRHILDQPPLMDGEGPIGLIMAPARELASQIFQEAKKFTKPLGLRVACIYGGAGVAEQIADLKRGSEVVVCTPGRMIDILCMQAGKLVSLKRVTMVVMDEADRMFDMGFEPQIKMILQNIRPDRQTVLFSATFPKQIEKLARQVLRLPLEIIVGERSTVNKDITQVIEVHEEEDKFLRLLQLLGVWNDKGSVLIFVDKQEKCDQLFQDLLKLGYPCLSLHGGKDQVDRDHTLHEFKTGIKTVMVATSVAGRGLDVPDIVCVVNYHCPNHIEDYVHRVGRTGRAGRKGTAYTFVSQREDQYAPSMVKVLQKAEQPVPQELLDLANAFRAKVTRGEAHWVSSGFEGKGFTFDASEMNETQKVANMQKKAYDREQGLVPTDTGADADDEDDELGEDGRETMLGGSGSAHPSSASLSAVPTVSPSAAAVAPVITPDMSPLERAKALAASIAANRIAGATAVTAAAPETVAPSAVPVDPQAALARAKLIAMQMAAGKGGVVVPGAEEHYSDELEINDYPHQARRKVTNKATMDDICDRTGVAVISRGSFIPAGKKPEAGERRLHLLIEGTNEMGVKQARLEILKVLEDETIRISSSGSLATTGRYSVL